MNKDKGLGLYLFNVLIGVDQFFNCLTGGHPDHTISGRVGYYALQHKPWAVVMEQIINTIFFFDIEHCYTSIEWDRVALSEKEIRGLYGSKSN